MQEVMGLCMEKARKLPTSAHHLKTEGNAKYTPLLPMFIAPALEDSQLTSRSYGSPPGHASGMC